MDLYHVTLLLPKYGSERKHRSYFASAIGATPREAVARVLESYGRPEAIVLVRWRKSESGCGYGRYDTVDADELARGDWTAPSLIQEDAS